MRYYEVFEDSKNENACLVKNKQRPEWEDGSEMHTVFSVRIDKLKFNVNNGRIATFVSQYNSDPKNIVFEKLSNEKANEIIGNYIVESHVSKETYKKTKRDIEIKGQIRPGLILDDGTVISGNRRFQILRELYNETQSDKYRYFDCFIIPKPVSDEGKLEIKKLELKTQNGLNEKVDYNPIDKLVSMRDAFFGPNKMSISNYSEQFNMKKTDVESYYYRVAVMDDYLKSIDKEGCYYIIRYQKLDGPINEVSKIYKKLEKDGNLSEWARIRPLFYIGFSEKGDTTRIVRDYKNMYEKNRPSFEELLKKAVAHFDDSENSSSLKSKEDKIKSIALNSNFNRNAQDIREKSKKEISKEAPVKALDGIFNKVCSIDMDELSYFDTNSRRNFVTKANDIIEKLKEFIDKLNNN